MYVLVSVLLILQLKSYEATSVVFEPHMSHIMKREMTPFYEGAGVYRGQRKFVNLFEVDVIFFYADRMASSSYSHPIHQMDCFDGCTDFTPEIIICFNGGRLESNSQIDWLCTAPLPIGYKLIIMEINTGNSPIIAVGAWSVLYRLQYLKPSTSLINPAKYETHLRQICRLMILFNSKENNECITTPQKNVKHELHLMLDIHIQETHSSNLVLEYIYFETKLQPEQSTEPTPPGQSTEPTRGQSTEPTPPGQFADSTTTRQSIETTPPGHIVDSTTPGQSTEPIPTGQSAEPTPLRESTELAPPRQSTKLTHPSQSSESTPSGQYTEPTPPEQFTEPTPPGQSTERTKRGQSTELARGQSTELRKPGKSSEPTPPGQSTEPTKPRKFTEPTKPGQFAEPTKPIKPADYSSTVPIETRLQTKNKEEYSSINKEKNELPISAKNDHNSKMKYAIKSPVKESETNLENAKTKSPKHKRKDAGGINFLNVMFIFTIITLSIISKKYNKKKKPNDKNEQHNNKEHSRIPKPEKKEEFSDNEGPTKYDLHRRNKFYKKKEDDYYHSSTSEDDEPSRSFEIMYHSGPYKYTADHRLPDNDLSEIKHPGPASFTLFKSGKWTYKQPPCVFIDGEPCAYDERVDDAVPNSETIFQRYKSYMDPVFMELPESFLNFFRRKKEKLFVDNEIFKIKSK